MFRGACAIVLFGVLTVSAPAAPPAPMVFEAAIKDVRGTDGTLTLTLGEGKQATDREFLIVGARFVGPDGAEMKVGDLHQGDRVRVEMTADGLRVQLVQVMPAQKAK
jgi:hypothetical protein